MDVAPPKTHQHGPGEGLSSWLRKTYCPDTAHLIPHRAGMGRAAEGDCSRERRQAETQPLALCGENDDREPPRSSASAIRSSIRNQTTVRPTRRTRRPGRARRSFAARVRFGGSRGPRPVPDPAGPIAHGPTGARQGRRPDPPVGPRAGGVRNGVPRSSVGPAIGHRGAGPKGPGGSFRSCLNRTRVSARGETSRQESRTAVSYACSQDAGLVEGGRDEEPISWHGPVPGAALG